MCANDRAFKDYFFLIVQQFLKENSCKEEKDLPEEYQDIISEGEQRIKYCTTLCPLRFSCHDQEKVT